MLGGVLEAGKHGGERLGPIKPLTANSLEPLLPLLLRLDKVPAGSYVSGFGTTNILAFIDTSGEIVSSGVDMEEYDNHLEIEFIRRDLSPLLFEVNYVFYGHFLIV